MIYCDYFAYKPTIKNLDWAKEETESKNYENVQVAFIQIESHDSEDLSGSVKKLVNFVKWVARKNTCEKVILHSFAHLSESKAEPEITKEIFDLSEIKLENGGYETTQTPFGYFLDLDLKAPGFSMARVFKSF